MIQIILNQLMLYRVLCKVIQAMTNVSVRTLSPMRLAAIILLLSILILPGCGKALYQESVGSESSDPDLRVMAYNIQHGRGMDGEVDLERIAQVILIMSPEARFMKR